MATEPKGKKKYGHGRTASFINAASGLIGGGLSGRSVSSSSYKSNDNSSGTMATTQLIYGSSKRISSQRSALAQSRLEQQLWDELETDGIIKETTQVPLIGLGVLDFERDDEKDNSWEQETSKVLEEIESRPMSIGSSDSFVDNEKLDKAEKSSKTSEFPQRNSINSEKAIKSTVSQSDMTRSLSTCSVSSKSTVEYNKSIHNNKHVSVASSVSTLNNFTSTKKFSTISVSAISVDSHNPSRRESANSSALNLSSNMMMMMNNGSQSSLHARRSPVANKNLPILSGNPSITTKNDENIMDLDIPRIPVTIESPSSPSALSPTISAKSKDSKLSSTAAPKSPSTSSFLSFKKSGNDVKHKKVSKSNISLPTGLVDSNDYFETTSLNSINTSMTNPTLNQKNNAPQLQQKPKNNRKTSGHKNGSSVFSSISSSSLFSSKEDTSRQKHWSLKSSPSFSSFNVGKKSSFSDIRRSIFSSSTSIFRSSSPKKTSEANKPIISLPTPVDASREKLRNKLRASNSLLSLAKSESNGSLVAVPVEEYQQAQLQSLLGLCNSSDIYEFDQYIDDINDESYHQLYKLAEASFSEVFVQDDLRSNSSRVFKIVAFGNEDLQQLPVQDIIQELTIARLLMSLDGFVDVVDAAVVRGEFPKKLLQLWDEYDSTNEKKSENHRPDFYEDDQLYCIMVLNNAGTDLEHFELTSWLEAETIFWQTVNSLAIAEQRYKFEHRDLHWGNIVVSTKNDKYSTEKMLEKLAFDEKKRQEKQGSESESEESVIEDSGIEYDYDHTDLKVTLIDYTLSRATNPDGTAVCTRLDHPDFFKGKGDYQFDIYRFMRGEVTQFATSMSPTIPSHHKTPSSPSLNTGSSVDWSIFCPKTNVLWLHYLANKLLNNKGIERVTMTRSGRLSFRKDSNGSLNEAFNNNTSTGQLRSWANDEGRACKALETIHSSLNPRKKRFPRNNNSTDSSTASSGQFPQLMNYQDFNSAHQVLTWGVKTNLIPQDVLDSF